MRVLLYILFLFFCSNIIAQDSSYTEYCKATYYHRKFEGRKTSTGEKFSHKNLTAAHHKLPFDSYVRVTNLENNKSVVVRINDRMPKRTRKSKLDLTYTAAIELGMIRKGRIDVKIELVDSILKDPVIPVSPAVAQYIKTGSIKKGLQICDIKVDSLELISEKLFAEIDSKDSKADTSEGKSIAEFLNTELNEIEPTGFGIQLVSFNSLSKAHQEALKLDQNFDEPITIQRADLNGKLKYRIILGMYDDVKALSSMRKKLIREYRDCFAMKFSTSDELSNR